MGRSTRMYTYQLINTINKMSDTSDTILSYLPSIYLLTLDMCSFLKAAFEYGLLVLGDTCLFVTRCVLSVWETPLQQNVYRPWNRFGCLVTNGKHHYKPSPEPCLLGYSLSRGEGRGGKLISTIFCLNAKRQNKRERERERETQQARLD